MAYLGGWACLIGVVAPMAWAGAEWRRRLLPGWSGAPARLAEMVVATGLATVVTEMAGAAGVLRAPDLVALAVMGGSAIAVLARRGSRSPVHPLPGPATDGWAVAGAAGAIVAVTAQWLAWTGRAYRLGMTAYDGVSYHGAVAARFAQTGSIRALMDVVPGEAVTFHPMTTELWHAVGLVAFHSDLATPAFNLAALAVALLAGWCAAGPSGSAGVALVCAVPYIGFTQPGSSFNDAPGLAAFLAAAVLLERAGANRRAGWFAAIAAGLAVGIKLSFLAPAVLLAAAATWLAPRGRRAVTAMIWIGVELVAGGAWYLRNLVIVGNPLPALHDGLPAPALPVDARFGTTLATGFHLRWWSTVYYPGLRDNFGRSWPLMLFVVAIAVPAGLLRRRHPWDRAMAVVLLLGLIAYAATPVTGDPTFFGLNVRYTIGLQGLAVLILARLGRPRLFCALMLGAIALAWIRVPVTRRDPLQLPAWPPGHGSAAVVVGAAVVGLITVSVALARARPSAGAGMAVVAVVAVVATGAGVDPHYETWRYRAAGGQLSRAWAWAQQVRPVRIGVVGVYEQYPLTGPHQGNVVQYVGVSTPHHGFARIGDCPSFDRAVTAGRYRYVVTSDEVIGGPATAPPEASWLARDPAAHPVVLDGPTAVFEVTAPLDPARCP